MISVIQTPEKEIQSGKISKWTAVHNRVLFKLQRKDWEIDEVYDAGGIHPVVRFNTDISLIPNYNNISVDDYIYVNSGNYNGVYKVTAVSIVVTYCIIAIDAPFNGTSIGGFINSDDAFPNYHLITGIYSDSELIGTMRNKPDSTGLILVDCSQFLKSLLQNKNEFDYSQINKKDVNLSGKFNIDFSEYTGNILLSGFLTLDYYFVNSAQQIKDKWGENVGEYVPFNAVMTDKAKFLNDLEEVTYFPDYPFDLGFIFSEDLGSSYIERFEETFTVNNGSLGITEDGLLSSEKESVNRLMLKQSYGVTVSYLDVWLEIGECQGTKYVADGYVAKGYVEVIANCGIQIVSNQNMPIAFMTDINLVIKGTASDVIRIGWGDSTYEDFTLTGGVDTITHTYTIQAVYTIQIYGSAALLENIKIKDGNITIVNLIDTMTDLVNLSMPTNFIQTFILSKFLTELETIDFSDNYLTSFTINAENNKLTTIDLSGNNLTSFILPSGLILLSAIDLSNNELDSYSVDDVLVKLDASGVNNGTVVLTGGINAPPTAVGLAAKANLITKTWTVTHN